LNEIKDKQIIPHTIAEKKTIYQTMRQNKRWVKIKIINKKLKINSTFKVYEKKKN